MLIAGAGVASYGRCICLLNFSTLDIFSMTFIPILFKDINTDSSFGGDSFPGDFIEFNGSLFFRANDGSNGSEPWKSDGTAAGTVLFKDINPTSTGSLPDNFTEVNGSLFFRASDGTNGTELWKSDGTAAGTVLVKDIFPGAATSFPRNLTEVNGSLFFTADDGLQSNGFEGNVELWTSDGTATGTVLVKDIFPGNYGSYPENLTEFNGNLFFTADNGINGDELWKSDGTETGTTLVKDIRTGSYIGSAPSSLTEVNGNLFFVASDGVNGRELWKSDGTAAGTILVKDITPGSSGSFPDNLTKVNDTLFFTTNNDTELWKSDGTAAGTVFLKDINSGGSYPSYSKRFSEFNGSLFFSNNDGSNGRELWKSDGTSEGTVLVKDIRPGTEGSSPKSFTEANGTLFFTADDGINGRELWQSDGTAAGTVLIGDINVGSSGSSPLSLTEFNGSLFFSADDGINGKELWTLEQENSPDPVAVDDAFTTDEDTVLNGNVLDNNGNGADSAANSGALVVTQVNGSAADVGREIILTSGARIILNDDGFFEYDPDSRLADLDPGQTDTDRFTYTVDDGNGNTDTATVTVTVDGVDDSNDSSLFYFSGANDRTVGDITFASNDIVAFNGADFEIAFDGSDVLPKKTVINAFDIISDTEILMAFAKPTTLEGIGRVDDSDVVKFIADAPNTLGDVTSGQFELYVDGSDLGLTSRSERIDGLTQLASGDLLISTTATANWQGGLKTKGQDIAQFSPTSTGDTTSGSVSQYFDGSDVSLSNSSETLDAIAVQDDDLLFSTSGNWKTSNTQSGRREDVGQFTASSFGASTSGNFADALVFDGSEFRFIGNISGFDFGVNS